MIKQDIIRLGDLLDKNIEIFLAGGGKLISHSFGNENDKCCAITASIRLLPSHLSKSERLSSLSGMKVEENQMWCIARGFDSDHMNATISCYSCEGDKELWQLGQDLRMKYLPVMR